MADFIKDAKSIVSRGLDDEFGQPGGSNSTIIESSVPSLVCASESLKVALHGQSLSGSPKTVVMLMPGLKRELQRLAELGSGHDAVVGGIKWKFMARKY